jgi:uncharacterized protein YjeT (DUF2065 family)
MDASSGLLLMTLPSLTLKLMRVTSVGDDSLVFIRFIGAFVFSVGCLYLFALRSLVTTRRWGSVWFVFLITAWVRTVICLFTTIAITQGALSLEWISVPITDGLLAVFQLWVIGLGWLSND